MLKTRLPQMHMKVNQRRSGVETSPLNAPLAPGACNLAHLGYPAVFNSYIAALCRVLAGEQRGDSSYYHFGICLPAISVYASEFIVLLIISRSAADCNSFFVRC